MTRDKRVFRYRRTSAAKRFSMSVILLPIHWGRFLHLARKILHVFRCASKILPRGWRYLPENATIVLLDLNCPHPSVALAGPNRTLCTYTYSFLFHLSEKAPSRSNSWLLSKASQMLSGWILYLIESPNPIILHRGSLRRNSPPII